jgi:hypothetical protein
LSIAIYYSVSRDTGLNELERAAIADVKEKFSVHRLIERYTEAGDGLNWEDLSFYYPPLSPGLIIEGATNLPDNTENALWLGVQHWCEALSEVRRQISGGVWSVHVDDHEICWDEARQAYDPTK